jgi:hypothetical protein
MAKWSDVITCNTSILITGGTNTGKTALGFWLLEEYAPALKLQPVVVGLPRDVRWFLPPRFLVLDKPEDIPSRSMVLVDEAGIQFGLEDTRARKSVVSLLSLRYHRLQTMVFIFHLPRQVLARYLPFFDVFVFKQPPALWDMAVKTGSSRIDAWLSEAEQQFATVCNQPWATKMYSYVVCPRKSIKEMMLNPLPSFWNDSIRRSYDV